MDLTALYKLSCGLYVITTVDGGRGVGCVVNTVTQVTAEPVQVMVAINKENFTAGAVQRSGRFAVSVLTESAPMELIGRFGFRSSKDEDKFEGLRAVEFKALPCPAEHVNAVLVCKVKETVDSHEARHFTQISKLTEIYAHRLKCNIGLGHHVNRAGLNVSLFVEDTKHSTDRNDFRNLLKRNSVTECASRNVQLLIIVKRDLQDIFVDHLNGRHTVCVDHDASFFTV